MDTMLNPRSVFAGRSRVRSDIGQSWFYGLYRQEGFSERLRELYRETCLPLLDSFLKEKLEAYEAQIAAASAMNQIRWEALQAYGISASEETERIRAFMEARIEFLNQLWLEQEPFHWVLVDANDGNGTACFAVRPGEKVPFLPDYEPSPEILGWYIAGLEATFDVTQPIWEDMEIVLRRAG